MHWRLVGPFRAGWASMVEGVPSRPDTFFFGAAGGGVWRTDNAGRTWTPLFQDGPIAPVGAIAVAPSDPDTIYIGTGQPDLRYDVQAGMGVFRSTDGGKTWAAAGLEDTRYVGRILVDPKDAKVLLVGAMGHFFGEGGSRGVYRSTDGGRTWTHPLQIDNRTGVVDLARDPSAPNVVFAAAWQARQWPWLSYFTRVEGPGSGVYRSTDGGVTWTRLAGEGLPRGPIGRIGLAVTHTAAGTRVYATVDAKGAAGIYRSDDAGDHWRRVNEMAASSNSYFGRITADPADPDAVYTTGQSIRRCDQAGARCEIIKGSPGGDDYHHIWVNPLRPDHIATAADQGTVVSVDGGRSWSSWYNQPTGQFYHLAADDRFPYWIYSGQQDSGTVGIASRSDYGSITFRDWSPVGGDERDYDIPDPEDPGIVYGSGLGGRISRWDARTGQVRNISPWPVSSYGRRPTTVKYRYNWVSPIATSLTGPVTLYSGAQLLFASTDRGEHWREISPDLTGKQAGAQRCDGDVAIADARACGYGAIVTIRPSARDAAEIWVGTDSGLVQLTRNGGADWTDVTPPSLPAWAKISSIDLGPRPGVAYAAVDNQRQDDFEPHVWATADYGRTWRQANGGLPAHHFVSVVRADPERPGLLYAGTDAGVFVSFDDGGAWRPLQQNLPTVWVRDLLVHHGDLVAATQGRGLWVMDDLSPLRQIQPGLEQKAAHLFTPAKAWRVRPDNNRDTPLPPETPAGENPPSGAIIDYWLGKPAKAPVSIEIRDARGRLVQRLGAETFGERPEAERYFAKAWIRPEPAPSGAAGMHRVVWNLRWARPLAVGYNYSIAAVWGRDTPLDPQGPFVVPGRYEVVLKVDGREQRAPIEVANDPRVSVSGADLQASLDLSQQVAGVLAEGRRGHGEMEAVRDQLAELRKAAPGNAALGARLERLDQATAGTAAPDFATPDGMLVALETDLESADAAPTAAQRAVYADASARTRAASDAWAALRRDLPALNAELKRARLKPIVVPAADRLVIRPAEGGEEMP